MRRIGCAGFRWIAPDMNPNWPDVVFCASTDGENYGCADPWSGYSGDWVNLSFSLNAFAGSPTVYLAWIFTSDESYGGDSGYLGAFLDEIWVYGYPAQAAP